MFSRPGLRKPVTRRQGEILDLVAEGLADKEIARRLGISPNTVRTHLQRVFRDQEVPNRAAAASTWVEDRGPSGSTRRGSRLTMLIGTLLAVATLAIGVPHLVEVASRLVAPPASGQPPEPPARGTSPLTGAGRPAPSPSSTSSSPAAVQATGSPSGPIAVSPRLSFPNPVPAPPLGAADPAHAELAAINRSRATAGQAPLGWSDCLAQVAATNAARIAAQGFISTGTGPLADAACGAGQPVEIATYWSSVDDSAATAILLDDPAWKAAVLGPHSRFGAAWAVGPRAAYLVIEMA